MRLLKPLKGIGTIPGIYPTQEFGENQLDYSQFGMIGHNGIDIAAPRLTPILAVHDGWIQFLTDSNHNATTGYGKNVRLYFDEEGYTWDCIYGHLDHYEGEPRQVKAGDIIGYVDSTGFSTGDHLHFGIRKIKNGVIENYNNGYFGYIDPKPFFKGASMNQAKVVRSKNSPTVWVCYPMPSEDYLTSKASLEGFEIPSPIPDTDSLF